MSLADLVTSSKAAAHLAHNLSQSGRYPEIVETLEPVIGRLMEQRQNMPNIFLVNFCLAQALDQCSTAKYLVGRLEGAVNGWEQAKELYFLATKVPLGEVRKQSIDYGLGKYAVEDPEQFSLLKTEAWAAIASSSLSSSQALQQLGRHEEARKKWRMAKECYSGLFDINGKTPIAVGTLIKAAIEFAEMCIKDGEFSRARQLYFLAASAQPELAPSYLQSIRQGLSTTTRLMAMQN